MNKTILQGKWRQARGSLKTQWGDLTDDDRRMLEGKLDQMIGLFQERYGYTEQRAAHALRRYMGGYGRRSQRHAVTPLGKWQAVLAVTGFLTLVSAGWFALTRITSGRCEEASSEYAGQSASASPEVTFD